MEQQAEKRHMSLVRLTSTGDVRIVTEWARPDVYEAWLAQLSSRDYKAIIRAMNAKIDRMDVVRTQYVVCQSGDEWYKVYWPVFEAMGGSREMSGKFIGLILWEVMYNRPEDWGFHKIDKTIVNDYDPVEDIQVMEYFRAYDVPRPGRWRDELARENAIDKMAESLRAAWRQ
jgi:hypothetical protein